ncbi:methyltransferase domain-containing protein [Streptomonospora sp. S1-112]|uniref:Methyltransferase domain-containing protein n=1 Tax=Streptomonospora mangrovi TaxID=2883123 RepID=A0A9X3SHN7_9ACTN|nr:class I SAM-dependent methyltransferase [Streptomonospora mangrovi]MDA0565514.1 methyltransferase domain-containing protein [Streptomonospora mangrovi]
MSSGQTTPDSVFRALLSPAGRRVVRAAEPGDVAADPLKAATRLRRVAEEALAEAAGEGTEAGAVAVPADALAGAALTQARLRGRAREKFGARAERLYFTPDGLEQATRSPVAAYRARRLAAALPPDARVADLCCGIGADMVAMAEAGLRVEGVDADPLTAAVAEANLAELGLAERGRVRVGDAAAFDSRGFDAVFCDPARRNARGRVFDPAAYSPPWPAVLAAASGAPASCVKAAPGIPHEAIPADAEAEWISVDGDLKETALWRGAGTPGGRRATLLRGTGGAPATLTADPGAGPAPVGPPGRYLYEPDNAVVRAHLVAEAAALVGGALLDPHIAYITADRLVPTPFCRVLEVREVLPFSLKRLRAVLRERGVGRVTIKKRGSAVDVDKLRRDLRPAGPESAVVVLTRVGNRPISLVCSEVTGTE